MIYMLLFGFWCCHILAIEMVCACCNSIDHSQYPSYIYVAVASHQCVMLMGAWNSTQLNFEQIIWTFWRVGGSLSPAVYTSSTLSWLLLFHFSPHKTRAFLSNIFNNNFVGIVRIASYSLMDYYYIVFHHIFLLLFFCVVPHHFGCTHITKIGRDAEVSWNGECLTGQCYSRNWAFTFPIFPNLPTYVCVCA